MNSTVTCSLSALLGQGSTKAFDKDLITKVWTCQRRQQYIKEKFLGHVSFKIQIKFKGISRKKCSFKFLFSLYSKNKTSSTSRGSSDSAPLLTSWKSFCTLSRAVINDGRTVDANEFIRCDAGNEIR